MVFSWDRKPAKRKYISVKNKSIRVKYCRISPPSSGEQDPVAIDAASASGSGSIPKDIPSASGSELEVDKQSEEAVFFSDALDEAKVTYRDKKKKRLENWAALADDLVEVGTAVLFTPPHSQCICCMQNLDQVYRCMDCGTSAVYCRECLDICHSLPHLHVFEVFKNGTFICVDTETPVWKRPDNHECQTIYCKQIVVLDEHGWQHKRVMELCGCESAAVTMIRSYLWPSSPKNPILGFHIGLLEWMTALLLECHVSTKGFCEAVKAKLSRHHKGLVDSEFKDVYRILMNECLVQYQNFRYKISHPIHLCEDIDSGIHCPACFENPQKIISFDADFQLVRKVSSGSEAGKPKHDGHFFIDQDEVDKFIDEYSTEKEKIKQEKAVHNVQKVLIT
ncbi:hypothetical protein ACJMK2_006132 [Sinanodonta woodiana]|uniref:CxC1-like cysteine cluster associated with KDZ transposases domain-containing protein n=1 Tax=Sinanodonta woodiana TaxID=1069815 RepID=A0ABD3VVB0_SINWO